MDTSSELYLPEECWESVFKFMIDDKTCLKSLSLVSKRFFSITNYLRSSLTIYYPTRLILRRLFRRFPNLTSLDLSCYHGAGDLDALLREISLFPLKLTSLNLSTQLTFPANGLRDFSKNITTLTSLNCHGMNDFNSSDLFLIAECFPLLEELDLGHGSWHHKLEDESNLFLEGIEALSSTLSKLRKVNLCSHDYINDKIVVQLFKNNKFLEDVDLFSCHGITMDGMAAALRERPTLRSISFCFAYKALTPHYMDSLLSLKCLTCLELIGTGFSDEFLASIAMKGHPLKSLVLQGCVGYSNVGILRLLDKCQSTLQHLNLRDTEFLTDQHVAEFSLFLGNLVSINLSGCNMLTDSTLFELVRNCPSLRDMDIGSMSIETTENSDFVVNHHQLKSLCLEWNSSFSFLQNENIIMLASIFPNLERLDLSNCDCISEEGIGQLLMKCCNIRHLKLYECSRVRQLGVVNFEVPKLEVLDLSYTPTDDETLYQISKSCYGLLQLILTGCLGVTYMGVKHVIQNCTQLREIDLSYCNNFDASVVLWMVVSRPSLRKIIAPPEVHFNDNQRKRFLWHGCYVEL